MRKTMFAVGLATGYVLGARAGRERYESIARVARRAQGSQTVQSAAGVLWAKAGSVAGTAAGVAERKLPFAGRLHLADRLRAGARHDNGVQDLVDYHTRTPS